MSTRRPAILANLAVIALAVVVVLAVVGERTRDLSPPTRALDAGPASPTASTALPGPLVVATISDGHLLRRRSWLGAAFGAGLLDGLERGADVGRPGAVTADLSEDVEEVSDADAVVVSAGTGDIASGMRPQQVAQAVEALVTSVEEAGPVAVLSLLPPSALNGAAVDLTNRLLRRWAEREQVDYVDAFAPVGMPDGRWQEEMSDDGRYANREGSARIATSAGIELATLLADT